MRKKNGKQHITVLQLSGGTYLNRNINQDGFAVRLELLVMCTDFFIECNCPECQFDRSPEKREINTFYNTLFVKAKDWGKVKFKWDTKYFNICTKKLIAIAETFNQKHYQWLIRDRIGHLVIKSENTTDAEAKQCR